MYMHAGINREKSRAARHEGNAMVPFMSAKCFTGCALVMLILSSCITRDNPFDPVNRKAHVGRTYVVSNQDSLMARVFSALPGDTIALTAGTFRVSLRFGYSGSTSRPIVVTGANGGSVVTAQPGLGILYLSGQHSIHVSGVVFDSSNASGAKVENGSSDILFESCAFLDNSLDGLEITDSDVGAMHCTFVHNGRAGLSVNGDGSGSHAVTLDNVLSAHNTKDGISVTAAPLAITHATISDNGNSGIVLTTPAGEVRVALSILSFNAGAGVAGLWSASTSQLVFDSLDIDSNGTAFSLSPTVSPSYWIADPMFADRNAGDYSIGAASEIDSLQLQGIVVGYRE